MQNKPTLSKATFRGTLIFVALLIVVFLLPDILMSFNENGPVHISSRNKDFQESLETVQRNSRKRYDRYEKGSRYQRPSTAFNPNLYTLEEWMALGLSEKQAAVVIKFTKRGLRSNEDLKRIFVISDELFALIKDSTVYPAASVYTATNYRDEYQPKPVVKVNINTASMEELMTVKGVGPFFAKQIVKLRDELGGFYDASQLMDVWKMDEEKLNAMLPGLELNPQSLRKININTATAEELKTHPYISWNLANSIVKLRSQNGPYKSVEGVRKSVLMTAELYEKLKRYLTADE